MAAPAAAAVSPSGFIAAVAGFEKRLLEEALQATRHNQRAAARRLDLNYHQLRHLLKKHGIGGSKGVRGLS